MFVFSHSLTALFIKCLEIMEAEIISDTFTSSLFQSCGMLRQTLYYLCFQKKEKRATKITPRREKSHISMWVHHKYQRNDSEAVVLRWKGQIVLLQLHRPSEWNPTTRKYIITEQIRSKDCTYFCEIKLKISSSNQLFSNIIKISTFLNSPGTEAKTKLKAPNVPAGVSSPPLDPTCEQLYVARS